MIKKHYEIPESELLLVKFEGNIMSPFGKKGYTGAEWDSTNTNEYDDEL